MKLLFESTLLDTLRKEVEANPECIGIQLTEAEALAIYEEYLRAGHSNCILLTARGNRSLLLCGRQIPVTIKN